MTDLPIEPVSEPAEEAGEDPETHLLPNLERLRAMTPEARRDLRDRVADWDGPLVDQFRARVAELEP